MRYGECTVAEGVDSNTTEVGDVRMRLHAVVMLRGRPHNHHLSPGGNTCGNARVGVFKNNSLARGNPKL